MFARIRLKFHHRCLLTWKRGFRTVITEPHLLLGTLTEVVVSDKDFEDISHQDSHIMQQGSLMAPAYAVSVSMKGNRPIKCAESLPDISSPQKKAISRVYTLPVVLGQASTLKVSH